MKRSIPLVLTLLVLAVLAWSPLGQAAGRTVASFAKNAGAVNGIKASRKPAPGRLLPLGKNGKFPSAVVPVVRGARGADGAQGPRGLEGARGPGRARRSGGSGRPGRCDRTARPGRPARQRRRPREHCRDADPQPRAGSCSRPPAARPATSRSKRARSANNAKASAFLVADNPANVAAYVEDDDLDSTDGFDFLGSSDDDVAGTLVYRAPAGASYVSVSFLAEQQSVGGANRCIFGGTATAAG